MYKGEAESDFQEKQMLLPNAVNILVYLKSGD